ncbi:MAG: energy-coupling factor transporter transmembrane protein EcfT [Treponema sp.]|jgi:cobalt/nickel transport system permease protein|nr:energy-coupling factor transporter transmembrane protein EcfT [Treponema sp.]
MYLDRLEFKNDVFKAVDPRCRIAAGVCLIVSAVSVSNPLILAGLVLAAALTLRRDTPRVLARLVPVNIFVLFLWLTLPLNALGARIFAAPGTAVGSGLFPGGTGGWGLEPALKQALVYTLRINVSALVYMALIIPLGIGGLTNALMKLRFPVKLAALFLLSYRYIFVMYQRVFVGVLSLRLRQPRQGTLGRWRSYAAVFGTALISAIFRSQKIGRALQCRDFDGALPLTRAFALKPGDLFFFGGALLLSAGLPVLDIFFNGFLPGKTWNF